MPVAIRELSESQSISVALMKSDPTSQDYRRAWIETTKLLATIELAADKPDQANLQWNSFKLLLTRMIEDDDDTVWAKQELEYVDAELNRVTAKVIVPK